MKCMILLLVVAIAAPSVRAQTPPATPSAGTNTPSPAPAAASAPARPPVVKPQEYQAEIGAELLDMAKQDQAARKRTLRSPGTGDVVRIKISDVDKQNTARLKEIVDQYGWPGKTLVGIEGARAAWLLIQHADADPAFQKECLQLMEDAAKRSDVDGQDVAYLTDRVLIAEHKSQRYGTQVRTQNGKLVPFPIEDEANVDKRRQEIGLPSLEDYMRMVRQVYGRGKSSTNRTASVTNEVTL